MVGWRWWSSASDIVLEVVRLVVAPVFCLKKKSRESISGQVSGFGAVVLLKLCVCGAYVVRMWCVCGALL